MFKFKDELLDKRIKILEEQVSKQNELIEKLIQRLYDQIHTSFGFNSFATDELKIKMIAQEFGSVDVLRNNFKKLLDTLDLEFVFEPSKTIIKKKEKVN